MRHLRETNIDFSFTLILFTIYLNLICSKYVHICKKKKKFPEALAFLIIRQYNTPKGFLPSLLPVRDVNLSGGTCHSTECSGTEINLFNILY